MTVLTPHPFGSPVTSAAFNQRLTEIENAIDAVIAAGSAVTSTLDAVASAGTRVLSLVSAAGYAVGDAVFIGAPGSGLVESSLVKAINVGANDLTIGSVDIALALSAAADDIIDTAAAHGLKAGDRVVFSALSGGAGLTVETPYWVIAANLGAQTFQVSTTQGGPAVNFTSDITAGTAVKPLQLTHPVGTPVSRSPVELVDAREGSGTLRARLRELDFSYVTAARHGAVGDAVADDTGAIQAAFDAAGANGVVVLEGTAGHVFRVGPLTFPSGLRIVGRSGPQVQANQAELRYIGVDGGTLLAPLAPGTNTINLSIENVYLNGGALAAIVLDLTRTSYALLDRCSISATRAGAVGVLLDAVVSGQCYFNLFRTPKITAPVGMRFTRGANANQVIGGAIIGCGTGMEFLSLSSANVVIGTDMETSSVRHVYLDATANTFLGLHMEGAPIGFEVTANGGANQRLGTTLATSVTTPVSEAAGNRDQVAHELHTGGKPRWRLGLWQMIGDWVSSSTPWQFDALPFSATASSLFHFFRNTVTSGARQIVLFKGDGTATTQIKLDAATGDISTVGRLLMGPSFTIQVLTGTGSPESVVTADPGSLYLNRSGGAGTTLYVKQTGFGTNTGWAAK